MHALPPRQLLARRGQGAPLAAAIATAAATFVGILSSVVPIIAIPSSLTLSSLACFTTRGGSSAPNIGSVLRRRRKMVEPILFLPLHAVGLMPLQFW